ncbi:MAG: N-methyl-D-aspartate receptor NMDAR2C subunit [Planctomycetota bacterium]
MLDSKRFEDLVRRVGGQYRPADLADLEAAYSEDHRAYHTAEHIQTCLAELDRSHSLCERPDEVELALWYHDAVYKTRASDNEEQSALWAVRVLTEVGAPVGTAERVAALIRATTHDGAPSTQDAKVLVDIDLSILGAPEALFGEYETQIRLEYRWVPMLLYRSSRARILRSFLARDSIYSTPAYRDRLEEQARANLAHSILSLGGPMD